MNYILLPAYNEAAGLPVLFDSIEQKLCGVSSDYSVILVDDGSNDDTPGIARQYASRLPLEIISHTNNKGLGEAVKTGFKSAITRLKENDTLVTLDADNTHPIELIPEMVRQLHAGADIVIASRYCPGGEEHGVTLKRKVLSRGANTLLAALFPYPGVRDYTSGFRGYRGAAVIKAAEKFSGGFIESQGFTVMAEILLKLMLLEPRVREVPLRLMYSRKIGASKIKISRTIGEYARLIAKTRKLHCSTKKI